MLHQYHYLVKVTGRIFIPNIKSVFATMRFGPDCISKVIDRSNELPVVDSRTFAATPDMLEELFDGFSSCVDDRKRIYFEHVLAERICSSWLRGRRWFPVWQLPYHEGISGSSGKRLNAPLTSPKHLIKCIAYQVWVRGYVRGPREVAVGLVNSRKILPEKAF